VTVKLKKTARKSIVVEATAADAAGNGATGSTKRTLK
jgi:hypothetical protein